MVAEVEMIGTRVVEVYRDLEEAQTEHLCIEIKVLLRSTGDRRDVMNAGDGIRIHG
jgi:hypothetical protein